MTNVQATFTATLVDEWVRCGVRHAVVSPGSRSTPLALALAADDRLQLHVHHDERAAAFIALGIGKATGTPAVLLTTSGTAAAELHPAVVEAHQARVPMLVCTADRPPELQSVGAPQTIDQTHLYGRSVRWFAEPGVPDDATRGTWRSLAARAHVEATGALPGPVHLNLAFRDPLVGEPGELPPGRPDGAPWLTFSVPERYGKTPLRYREGRGVVVAGAGAAALGVPDGWPVLADPLSGVPGIRAFDALLRAGRMPAPDVVLRVGDAPASKVLAQWLASLDCPQHVIGSAFVDPDHTASSWSPTPVEVEVGCDEAWRALWSEADATAQRAIDDVLASKDVLTEPFVARTVSRHASTLVVSSSMPIRDVEWFGESSGRVLANRGANGIDGVVSTAIGVALGSGEPITVLVGDVALLHDSNALLGLGARGVAVTIVVVDNRGGGIFSFLPQASALAPERFELLFGTPHDVDLERLAAAHGLPVTTIGAPGELPGALERPGSHVVVVPTDRAANVAVHDELNAAVAAALGA